MDKAVIWIFFDIPTKKPKNVKQYRILVKYLLSIGFVRLQNSVYIKFHNNMDTTGVIISNISFKIHIDEGNVLALVMTRNQFDKIKAIKGELPKIDDSSVFIF